MTLTSPKVCHFIFVALVVIQLVVMITLQQRRHHHEIIETNPIISDSLQGFVTSFAPKINITVEDVEESPGWDTHESSNEEREPSQRKHQPDSSFPEGRPPFSDSNSNTSTRATATLSQNTTSWDALSTTLSNSSNLWDKSKTLPQWFKDYFNWHRKERAKLRPENWRSFKYLTMRCLDTDARCGGTADRIKTLPFVLYWAHRSQRLLLIHWSRPCKLEEFLLPPEGGVDWRVPDWLVDRIVHGSFSAAVTAFEEKVYRSTAIAVRSKLQSYNGGSLWYNENVQGPRYEDIYHDVWRCFFTPAPRVAKLIFNKLQELNLEPGNYVSAHLRGLYALQTRPEKQLRLMASNAVNCASNLHPGGPIYFASDSKYATDYVINDLAKTKRSTEIVANIRAYEPLHLEKAENWTSRSPAEYYDTFVDLYLLGLGRCVTYNVGGFGEWGSWLGYDSACFNKHGDKRNTFFCNWTDPGERKAYKPMVHDGPVLLPPMENENSKERRPKTPRDQPASYPPVWKSSNILPTWMKEYFAWHIETKAKLSEANWNQTRYLVMQCTDENDRCGGTSDRLQPLPLLVHLAAKNKRLLLIRWTRPCPLEEFLVPAVGGIDWRVPQWMIPHVHHVGPMPVQLKGLLPTVKGSEVVVRTKYQSNNHGSEYFNEQSLGVMFQEVYHDLFRAVFQPSKSVARLLDEQMKKLQLTPGEYASAHFRVLYGREDRAKDETKAITINAINCASELRPGGPVYFAADQKYAVDVAREYAQTNGYPVVMVEHQHEPLHLDKADSRDPSGFYSVFVDLFLLGQSRCLAFNNGGFGQYGLLLGYNSSCSVRHHGKKILKHCPRWNQ